MSQTRAWMLSLLATGVLTVGVLATGCQSKQAAQVEPAKEAETETEDPTLTQVTLQLNWYPEAEHGGYFAAVAEGYYREAGLNVKILPGGPQTPVVQQVARRAATFGIVNADNVLFGRARQAPIVAVMAPLQISPRCIIVHESSGIRNFEQLKNVTLGLTNDSAFAQFLQKTLPLDGVKIIPYPGNVERFLRDKHYAQQGYVFSEPFVARKAGSDPRVLMVSELDFNPYTSMLFCHDDQVDEHPDLVRKMVQASIKGWSRYLEAPEKANALIHKMNPEMDLDILEFGAETINPLVLDDTAEQYGIGTMVKARWQTLADQLVDTDQLKRNEVHVDKAFTTRFLRPDDRNSERAERRRGRSENSKR